MTNDPTGDWPFDQPPNCATITTTHVMRHGDPILLVHHHADDHGWTSHDDRPLRTRDALLVSLRTIVRRNPSVAEVADLPPGRRASRDAVGGAWVREP